MKTNLIPIDLTYFNSITEGNKAFGEKLLASAMDDIHIMVARLDQSWKGRDVPGIKQAAHSLISLSAIAGMPVVEGWCRSIEDAFASGEFRDEKGELVANIISGWPMAAVQLQKIMESELSPQI